MDGSAGRSFFPFILGGLLIAANVASAADPPSAVPAAAQSALPPGQVWQCMVNGQRVFSDTRCGDDASVRVLGQLNRMDPTPVLPVAAYPPASNYRLPPGPPPDFGYASIPPEPAAADAEDDVYASPPVLAVYGRARREHPSRLHHHHHGPARKS